MELTPNSGEQTDSEFDAYWEEEARNPHRNRIRIGRQYQATIPPKLKPGESDGRKLENLEALTWRRENGLTDDKLNEYFVTSRALGLMGRYRVGKVSESLSATSTTPSSTTPNSDDKGIPNSANKNGICTDHDDERATNAKDKTSPRIARHHNQPPINSGDNKNLSFESEMIALSKFVSSHHPSSHDDACTVKKPDAKTDSWSLKEAKMFAHALETYGKNFGAIKKAMPWKAAKSIIDQYYKKSGGGDASDDESDDQEGNGGGGSGGLGGSSGPNNNNTTNTNNSTNSTAPDGTITTPKENSSSITSNSLSTATSTSSVSSLCSSKNLNFSQSLQVASCLTNGVIVSGHSGLKLKAHESPYLSLGSPGSNVKGQSHHKLTSSFLPNGSTTASNPSPEEDLLGLEVKPVKAKPIFKNDIPDPSRNEIGTANGASTSPVLGSLKFFMDGQLVLKLNATTQQQDGSTSAPEVNDKNVANTTNNSGRCQWVESPDTKILKNHLRRKKYRRTVRNEGSLDSVGGNRNTESSSTGSSGGGSGRASVVSCEDSEDMSSEDDDRESLESTESRSLPSPSPASTAATPRKPLTSKGVGKVDCAVARSPLSIPSPSAKDVKRDFSVYAFEDEPTKTAGSNIGGIAGGLSGFRKRFKSTTTSAKSPLSTNESPFPRPEELKCVGGFHPPSFHSKPNFPTPQSSALDLSSTSSTVKPPSVCSAVDLSIKSSSKLPSSLISRSGPSSISALASITSLTSLKNSINQQPKSLPDSHTSDKKE